jgi:hypothetical protein
MSNCTRQSFVRYLYLVFLILLVLACKRTSHYSSGPSYSSNTSPSPIVSSARNLPSGFRSIPPSSGTGDLLYGGMTGSSAKGAVFGALKALTGNFDSMPHVLAAMVTANDDEAQALIDGARDGQPIRGIAYAETTGSQCLVTVVYDRAEEFARSSADLVRLAQQTLPAAPSATPIPLQHTTLSDGTSLDLPGGWTVQPDNGAVGGTGPEGTFDFGRAMEVYTPEAAAYYAQPYGAKAPLVAAYGDPGRELQELWAQFKLVSTPDDIHIIERTSLPWWTSGPGEMIHFQGFINGSQSEAVAEVLTSPSGAGKWMYYYSGVSTSQPTFNQNLPTLMRIWQSWKTDDRVFQERLRNAAQSLQQCGQIIREANAYRQDAMERSSIAWDHYVRGTWPIEDQQTHSRLIPQQDVSVVVRKLNESEGYDRWRVVPYEELNR